MTSNIILIVMLIVFSVINIKGISPMFGAMIPVFMLLPSIIKKKYLRYELSKTFCKVEIE